MYLQRARGIKEILGEHESVRETQTKDSDRNRQTEREETEKSSSIG